MQKTKVCFVSLAAYPVLANTNLDLVGGAEIQQVILARELKKRGFDISFVVFDFGQESREVIDGVTIFKACKSSNNKRLLSFFPIFKALNQSHADIYYVRGGKLLVALVALYCRLKKKKLVYCVASDRNVGNKKSSFEAIIFKWALKNSNIVIAQNKHQQSLLRENFNKKSIVIKNHIVLGDKKPKKSIPPVILWVSTLKKEWKQPNLFLKLANVIPDAKFQMVGGPSRDDPEYFEEIKRLTSGIPNLDFKGFVPYHKVGKYFDRASIFVNTSSVEGFPNTFLQAWASYTPVISLNIDPDGIICKHKLGFHSKTFEQMVKDVKTLLEDERLREDMGLNGRKYVEREHDIRDAIEKYIRLFKEVNK